VTRVTVNHASLSRARRNRLPPDTREAAMKRCRLLDRRRHRFGLLEFLRRVWRCEHSREAPGGAGRRAQNSLQISRSENAENDGADEGERDVRGHNAQLAQQRTRGIHWEAPSVHNAGCVNAEAGNPFLAVSCRFLQFSAGKVSFAVHPGKGGAGFHCVVKNT
jgi:hypothetical protein